LGGSGLASMCCVMQARSSLSQDGDSASLEGAAPGRIGVGSFAAADQGADRVLTKASAPATCRLPPAHVHLAGLFQRLRSDSVQARQSSVASRQSSVVHRQSSLVSRRPASSLSLGQHRRDCARRTRPRLARPGHAGLCHGAMPHGAIRLPPLFRAAPQLHDEAASIMTPLGRASQC
jgi:hypothetical protein